jgi:NADH-quinone oxidoreductase subunit K
MVGAEITPFHFITLGLTLFFIGICGIILRRNIIFVFISLEVATNGIFLIFFGASLKVGYISQALVLVFMAIAAVEVAVGLALAIAIFRTSKTVNVDEVSQLKG